MGEIRDALDKGPGSLSCTTTRLLCVSREDPAVVQQEMLEGPSNWEEKGNF